MLSETIHRMSLAWALSFRSSSISSRSANSSTLTWENAFSFLRIDTFEPTPSHRISERFQSPKFGTSIAELFVQEAVGAGGSAAPRGVRPRSRTAAAAEAAKTGRLGKGRGVIAHRIAGSGKKSSPKGL